MNDVDVSRQIQQMVRFIRQEAEEKANEISVSAEEEFNIEKLQLVEAEKKKIRQEYERKEKQVDVRKKIFYSTTTDTFVKNAVSLKTPVAQAAMVMGSLFVHPNAPGAHVATVVVNPNKPGAQRASVVGQLPVKPNTPCAQGASVVGQPIVNPNAPVAQGASVVGQPVVNPNTLGAQGALVVGHPVVNPSAVQPVVVVNPYTSGSQGASVVGHPIGNPNTPIAQMLVGEHALYRNKLCVQVATVLGKHAVNPIQSDAQRATIVGQHAENPDVSGAQRSTIVGEQGINPNMSGAHRAAIMGQHASHIAHFPLVYPVVSTNWFSVNHAEKPEKFNGPNFTCWQQKMLFYLTTLNLLRFLEEEVPVVTAESDLQTRVAADDWNESDYLCRNYVLNCLVDSLYDMYSSKRTTKELWHSLDHDYRTEYAGARLYIVGRFLDYKMVDSKSVTSQVQDLQVIIHEIHAKGMVISESFQVAAIIEKLPFGWHEFKNRLKHKQKEISMGELILRLRIEEDNKRYEKKFNVAEDNIVEGHNTKFKKENNEKESDNVGKGSMGPKGQISKNRGKCFTCAKKGHKFRDCRLPKKP